MKKLISLIVCICLASVSLCACSESDSFTKKENLSAEFTRVTDSGTTYNYTDGATAAPTVYNSFSSEIADFELKLFRNYASSRSDKDSYVFAPIGTTLTLGLLANGSTDRTQRNIINALGDELELETLNQCSSYLSSRLSAFNSTESEEEGEKIKATDRHFVKLENTLLFNDTVDVRNNFLQTNANYYGFDIFRFVFSDNGSLDKLNMFFDDYSEPLAFTEQFADNQNLIAVSGCDIYDSWLNSYAQTDVSQGVFNSSDCERTVNYMTSNESYLHTETAQGIVKYTANTPLKFVAIIPNEGISLDDYISSLTYLEFSNMMDSFSVKSTVSASIPEFEIRQSSSTSMIDSLSDCGLESIFTDEITLPNISLSDKLFVDDIREIQPKITVDASGISGQELSGGAALLEKHFEETEKAENSLEFNRPFIFMLLDNESNIPVYIGTVDF